MKVKQSRLLHPDPIRDADTLDAAGFLKANPPAHETLKVSYRCRCGNRLELHIRAEAVVCVRCGCRMKAHHTRDPPRASPSAHNPQPSSDKET